MKDVFFVSQVVQARSSQRIKVVLNDRTDSLLVLTPSENERVGKAA